MWHLPNIAPARQAEFLHTWNHLQPRPHQRDWRRGQGSSSKPSVLVESPGCRHWWLWCHLPQQPPAPMRCSSTVRSRRTSPAQAWAMVPCEAAWGLHTGVFHLQSTPCTHFHPRASPACLGGLDIAAPSRSPAGAGTWPSSVPERGKEGGGAARSTWRWLWRRGESRRPGLCRDLPDPTATPTVPARPRAGTPRHSTHRSHQHPLLPPAPASWHRQPLPSPRRCQHPGVPASSQSTPPREMAAHIASKAQRFTTTGCITIFYR